MGRDKKEDTINLQNFETDLDISLKQKNIAGKKSEVEVLYPYTLSEKVKRDLKIFFLTCNVRVT